MADVTEVKVPDIGDFTDVPVIEVLVEVGQEIAEEEPTVVLESDKATMEIPSPAAGKVAEILVKVGDKVSEGTPILKLEGGDGGEEKPDVDPEEQADDKRKAERDGKGKGKGDRERESQEDVPDESPNSSGFRQEPPEREGSKPDEAAAATDAAPESDAPKQAAPDEDEDEGRAAAPPPTASGAGGEAVYASPSIRRLARERGVDLSQVKGTGRKGRITREDVEKFEAGGLPSMGAGDEGGDAGLGLAPWPKVDFAKYGEIERVPLSRIQRISGPNLARNWVRIPHVTHHDEADITDLEAFRKQVNAEQDVKVTMVALLLKACVASLKEFPQLNASLDGDELVLKRYYHLGFAADTPQGLVVPVIRDVDSKGLLAIAAELRELSGKAREGKLGPAEMAGGTFTISSLGGIGGTGFTPIVNAPEVAILGVTRSAMKPVWNGAEFEPRLMVPLSLSYDHRVIDGALAARFMVHLVSVLSDFRRVLL